VKSLSRFFVFLVECLGWSLGQEKQSAKFILNIKYMETKYTKKEEKEIADMMKEMVRSLNTSVVEDRAKIKRSNKKDLSDRKLPVNNG
jgi:hypothetical protein